METHFSQQQLADTALQEIDAILRRCVRCGLCIATCPTYLLFGDERDSPRGRIILIKDMLENERQPTPEVRFHIDRCLGCHSCMTTCPAGVDYMHLLDFARAYIEKKSQRSLKERLARYLLQEVVPNPSRFRLMLSLSWLSKPFRGLLARLRMKELVTLLNMAARTRARSSVVKGATLLPPINSPRLARVALFKGCAQSVVRPQINDAAIQLLRTRGVEVILPEEEGCCGGLSHHLGQHDEAREFARRNIIAWERVAQAAPLDAILTTTSGCGAEMKDYGHLLRDDPVFAQRAKRISDYVMDINEFLAKRIDIGAPSSWSDIRVAYHAPCSLQHAQGIDDEPRRLLREAGFTILDIPEGHICCGSAGTYNVLQPDISNELRLRKLANIASVKADCVASSNMGCMTHMTGPDAPPIVHVVELLNWAYGGECPAELAHLSDRARSMEDVFKEKALVVVEPEAKKRNLLLYLMGFQD